MGTLKQKAQRIKIWKARRTMVLFTFIRISLGRGVWNANSKPHLRKWHYLQMSKLWLIVEFKTVCISPFILIFEVRILLIVPWSFKASNADIDPCSLDPSFPEQVHSDPVRTQAAGSLLEICLGRALGDWGNPFPVVSHPLPTETSLMGEEPCPQVEEGSGFLLIPFLCSWIPKP